MTESVSLDFDLKSPIDRVWHALTDAATLSRWTFFDTEDFQPVVGHRCSFRGKESTGWTAVIECEVLEVDQPTRLSYTWTAPGWGGGVSATRVTWTLTAAGEDATRLHLEHSGFDSAATREIGGAKYGWTAQIGQLERLLANG